MTDNIKIITNTTAVNVKVRHENPIKIVSSGEGPRGPRGYPGETATASGDSKFVLFTHTPIGGKRLISVENGIAIYASVTENKPAIGLSLESVLGFVFLECQSIGSLIVPGVNWTKDRLVFLTDNGLFTQVPPTIGFSQSVGIAVDTNKLIIEITQPIYI